MFKRHVFLKKIPIGPTPFVLLVHLMHAIVAGTFFAAIGACVGDIGAEELVSMIEAEPADAVTTADMTGTPD